MVAVHARMINNVTVTATLLGNGMNIKIEEDGRWVTTMVSSGPRRLEIEAPPRDANELIIPVLKKIWPSVESLQLNFRAT